MPMIKAFIPLISLHTTASWLELEQPVELVENIFVDILSQFQGLAQLWEAPTEGIADRGLV